MRVAYVQGFAGVSGPALLGALLDAGASLDVIQDGWRRLSFPAAEILRQRVTLSDYTATQVTMIAPKSMTFLTRQTYPTLCDTIRQSDVSNGVRQRLLAILTRVADAVDRLQGPQEVVPSLSAPWWPDLLYMGSGVALALEDLAVAVCHAAPLNLGSGYVEGANSRAPVPRPLTAELVRHVPVYGDTASGELTTVEGAAILTALATQFGPLPNMAISHTGYGASADDSTHPPRGLQVLLGDLAGEAMSDRIAVLEANIDDMNPEFYEDIYARLFAQGALDVTLTPLLMKKNRPANKLTVLSPMTQVSTLSNLILQETSTFGVRIYDVWRRKLDRFWRDVETRYGVIPVKCGVLDGRIIQAAPEYDACKHLAQVHNLPVRLVYSEAARLAAPWLTD